MSFIGRIRGEFILPVKIFTGKIKTGFILPVKFKSYRQNKNGVYFTGRVYFTGKVLPIE